MTSATTLAKTYATGTPLQPEAAPVEDTQSPTTSQLARKFEAGVRWFTRNLTGQTNQPAAN